MEKSTRVSKGRSREGEGAYSLRSAKRKGGLEYRRGREDERESFSLYLCMLLI